MIACLSVCLCVVQDEDTPLEQALREEGEALRRRLAEADKELSIQQEKNIQLAELYMQALRRLEAHKADMDQRLAKLETENALLKGQVGGRTVATRTTGQSALGPDECAACV